MEVKLKKIILITCVLAIAAAMEAQIIHVPADYPTIQQGIDAASYGDTVLVDPGSYAENLFLDKNIVLASFYLITQDTSYISQTKIKGHNLGPVIIIQMTDTTCIVSGFTLQDGYATMGGGGISCSGSSPVLCNLLIKNNHADNEGGGIGCFSYSPNPGGSCSSSPRIRHVRISGNTSIYYGGGLYNNSGNTFVEDALFDNNSCYVSGIIDTHGGDLYLKNVTVTGNQGTAIALNSYGGSNATFNQVNLNNNYGFGIVNYGDSLHLSNVNIHHNAGGIINYSYGGSGEIVFDTIERCSIYSNFIAYGKDIVSDVPLDVVLDTFTVLYPTAFHVNQLSNFTFDIIHGYYEQINSDVYISPSGDDHNSGLNSDEPLKTIVCSQARLFSPHTIYLANGTYGPSCTGESFPVVLMDSLNLTGISADGVILEGFLYTYDISIIRIINNTFNKLSGLTLAGGRRGIWIENSNAVIENVRIMNNHNTNSYDDKGGGLYSSGSSLALRNVVFEGNSATYGGGLYFEQSNPLLLNVTIKENTADIGGGVYFLDSNPNIYNVLIIQNSAEKGGGFSFNNADALICNSTLAENIGSVWGGGMSAGGGSAIHLVNSIVWNNGENQIALVGIYGGLNSATINYSDLQDGEAGIYVSGNSAVNWLEGNITEDPFFTGSGEHPYSLSEDSPCIDTGTPDTAGLNLPNTDILLNKRIWDGDGNGIAIVDMGAYEFGAIPVGEKKIPVQCSRFQVSCYPNPAHNKITISSSITKNTQLSIFNVSGEKVMERQLTDIKTQIDISALTRGVYFVRVQNEMMVEVGKMIKE